LWFYRWAGGTQIKKDRGGGGRRMRGLGNGKRGGEEKGGGGGGGGVLSISTPRVVVQLDYKL